MEDLFPNTSNWKNFNIFINYLHFRSKLLICILCPFFSCLIKIYDILYILYHNTLSIFCEANIFSLVIAFFSPNIVTFIKINVKYWWIRIFLWILICFMAFYLVSSVSLFYSLRHNIMKHSKDFERWRKGLAERKLPCYPISFSTCKYLFPGLFFLYPYI